MPIRLLRRPRNKPIFRNGLTLPSVRKQIQKLKGKQEPLERAAMVQLERIATQINGVNQQIAAARSIVRRHQGQNVRDAGFRTSEGMRIITLRQRKAKLENQAKSVVKRFEL